MRRVRALEITFGAYVELTAEDLVAIEEVLSRIARRYEASAPGRIMWSFGHGAKMLINPLMLSDDEPIPFDDTVYHIEMAEREAYPTERNAAPVAVKECTCEVDIDGHRADCPLYPRIER